MKVILLQDIKSLGKRGELVEASDGYARNYLLPRKLAKEANAQAMNEYKNAENSKQYKIATEKAQAEAAKKKLEGKVFRMTARAGQSGKLFGSITSKQVAEEIKKHADLCQVSNTICQPTKERQKETIECARNADLVIVVGGKHSANTARLAVLCRELGSAVQHVETETELAKTQILQAKRIFITAGASTPEWVIDRVAQHVRALRTETTSEGIK